MGRGGGDIDQNYVIHNSNKSVTRAGLDNCGEVGASITITYDNKSVTRPDLDIKQIWVIAHLLL